MTPKQAIAFINEHGFATAQSRVEFRLAIGVLKEYVESQEITDEERVEKVKEHEIGVNMTLSEKLRFLADRAEDGKEFRFIGQTYIRYFDERGQQFVKTQNGKDFPQGISLKTIRANELEFIPKWEFTEDEKVILRNLPTEYRWIARDKSDNELWVYTSKPTNITPTNQQWAFGTGNTRNLNIFKHLFQSIKWSDDEPCEFRRYL